MRSRKVDARTMSPVVRPQADSGGPLQAGESDHVDERSPGEQRMDRGAVHSCRLGEDGDRDALVAKAAAESSCDCRNLDNANRSPGPQTTVGELAGNEVVGGSSDRTGFAGHPTSLPDPPSWPGQSLLSPPTGTVAVGDNPHHAVWEWEERVRREVGRRVHKVIGELVERPYPIGSAEILDAVRGMWRDDPIGGSVASSARLRCSTAVAVYLSRFSPVGWQLDGVEVALGGAVADLVWVRDDERVIDEVKTGAMSITNPRVADQLFRLAVGGQDRWERFLCVRLVPLGSPARSVTVVADVSGRLETVPAPVGMEVR